MTYNYDVFLSYRHKPLDGKITQKTFNMLESYKMPSHLKKQGFKGIKRVFRDTEELAVSRILSNTIEEALRSVNCLVVVCSVDTPSSEWVDREVETFIELGRAEKIYPLLISGDPDTSFPPSLKKVPDIMNRVMDVRVPGDDAGKIIAKEELELLRVIAEASGCHHSDLLRYHKMRKVSRFAALSFSSVALFTAVGLVSGYLWFMADSYKVAAQKEQDASMAMLESLTYDLPNALVELPGMYGRVSDILDKNVSQIVNILKLAGDDDSVAVEIGANYEKLATAAMILGDRTRAVESQNQAISIYQSLYDKGNQDAAPLVASAWNNAGVAFNSAGEYDDAGKAYDAAVSLQEPLLTSDRSFSVRNNLAAFLNNSGTNHLALGNYDEATISYEESISLLDELLSEGHSEVVSTLSKTCQNLGICLYEIGNYAEAQPWLEKSVNLSQALFDESPSRTNLTVLAQQQSTLATCLSLQAKFDEANHYFDLAIASQEILAADKENISAQNSLAVLYNNYGLCLNMSGDFEEAEKWYLKRAAIEENMNEVLGTPLSQAGLARAYYNVAENAFKSGKYDMTREYYDRCLALYAPVSAELGNYHLAEYLARLAYYQIIVTHNFQAALQNAFEAANLQPDSSFVLYILGYSLLYNNYLADCDNIFGWLAERSEGEVVNVILDFEALSKAGIPHGHMDDVIKLMEGS